MFRFVLSLLILIGLGLFVWGVSTPSERHDLVRILSSMGERTLNLDFGTDGEGGGFLFGSGSGSQSRDDYAPRASVYRSTVVRPVLVSENSTPAEPIIGSVSGPIDGVIYELNDIKFREDGNLRVDYKVFNSSLQPIELDSVSRDKLDPRDLGVQDFDNRRYFTTRYFSQQFSLDNCLIAEQIPAGGRVNCSVIVGPERQGAPGLEGRRVKVYFPGAGKPLPFFRDL